MRRLASFARLVLFDKRGTGRSDPVPEVSSLEQRMDDLCAVMDAAGVERADLFGISEGAHLCAVRGDVAARAAWARSQRAGASPAMARAVMEDLLEIDVRDVLPEVRVPTLVLHARDEIAIGLGCAEYLAANIPGARLVVLEGRDHYPFFGDADSTGRARSLGDRRWRDLLADLRVRVRQQLARFGGREMDTAGDGFFTAFDVPTQALRCARALGEAVAPLGLQLRVGVHAGECERSEGALSGMAVHVAARVVAEAAPGEVWVSSTVKELVAGGRFAFIERGARTLKGIPGDWTLYALE